MSDPAYETAGRNVFKDIGAPNAEERLIKAQLVFKIDTLMKERHLKQKEAADLFGVLAGGPPMWMKIRSGGMTFNGRRISELMLSL